MNLEHLISEYDKIRKITNSPDRISKSTEIATKMSGLLYRNKNIPSFNLEGGLGLLYVVYLKTQYDNHIYKSEHIFDTLKIYCGTTHNFIGDIARKELCKIFKLPCPVLFSDKEILEIHTYLKHSLPTDVSKSEEDRHNKLCEILATFFMMYSNIIYKNSKPSKTIDKMFKDSLIGQAVGDALGFLVEGTQRIVCEKYVNDVIKTRDFSRYGLNKMVGTEGYARYTSNPDDWVFKLGQYTDDTQLCRELIKSIAMHKKFVPSDFAMRIVTLLGKSQLLRPDTKTPTDMSKFDIKTGIVGYGRTTKSTAQCLADGSSWEQTGTLIKSQGNGGCMRVAPLGALYFEQPWKLKEISSLQSIGTHGSSRCRASCVMVSEATRLSCESIVYPWSSHIIKHPKIFCNRLSDQVRSIDMGVSIAIKLIPDWLNEKDEQKLVCKITKKGSELGDSLWQGGNIISASAVQTALFAVVCFLRHPDSYENAISMAIRAGGDTDTVAAICGAITAARTGNVLELNVNDRGNWGLDSLVKLSYDARNAIKIV